MIQISCVYNGRTREFPTPEAVGKALVSGFMLHPSGYVIFMDGKGFYFPTVKEKRELPEEKGGGWYYYLTSEEIVEHIYACLRGEIDEI